jgi:FkbM family methyltransferase
MNTFSSNDPVAAAIGSSLVEPFVLLDVGCSGGILPAWRAFDSKLHAYAFDPNIDEVARLRGKETNPQIVYEEAFVGVPEGHRLSDQLKRPDLVRASPWDRLSVAKTLNARKVTDNAELTAINQWRKTALTTNSIYLPDYLRSKQIGDVDFVKIDIDSADLIVLQTIFESPVHPQILGMLLEVNFHGTAEPDHHTFHNTDRLMRQMGFDLFDLSVRNYSSSALPWPYAISAPAQTVNGRPFQGDALYMRDVTAPGMREVVAGWSVDKLAKAAAVFSLSGHFDQAAEVLGAFEERLNPRFKVSSLLETLAQRIQKATGSNLSRAEYLAAFDADHPMFYPGWSGAASSASQSESRTSATARDRRKSGSRGLKKLAKRLFK